MEEKIEDIGKEEIKFDNLIHSNTDSNNQIFLKEITVNETDIPLQERLDYISEDRIITNSQDILNIYEEVLEDVEDTKHIFDKYAFDWDMMDVIIGGKSSIDLSRLTIKSHEEADSFLELYGYDLRKENIKKEVNDIFKEAISFIENVLIPEPITKEVNLFIPDDLKNETDVRELLLIASDYSNRLQAWSCVILRIMHTISHVNNDISLKFFPEIQRQILDNVWTSISINSKGEKFFGEEGDGIKIYDIDIKAKKERNSTILKLLHKVENVAADVFDQIGVRIITYDKVDALLVLRHLRKNGVLDFFNIKPSRSINRLIDVKTFKKILNYQKERLKSGLITKEEFENLIRQDSEREANITNSTEQGLINPYTHNEYKSIQFTCRQMIRMKYPFDYENPSLGENFCFFFPYEMQIVDINTHEQNRSGKASHEKYKEKQLISARKRVLGKFIKSEEVLETSI
ncbi:MAG: TIGR04552 family protein [Candidatus Sericytochromatia bacterium]